MFFSVEFTVASKISSDILYIQIAYIILKKLFTYKRLPLQKFIFVLYAIATSMIFILKSSRAGEKASRKIEVTLVELETFLSTCNPKGRILDRSTNLQLTCSGCRQVESHENVLYLLSS